VLDDDDEAKREGKTVELKLGEVGRHDVHAAVGRQDGLTVCVGHASGLVGKKVKVRIERVLDGIAYATLVAGKKAAEEPITAESAAEKPTRKPPAKKQETRPEAEAEAEAEAEIAEPELAEEPEGASEAAEAQPEAEQRPKKKTRRGSRGGRRRKKKPAAAEANGGRPPEQPAAEGDGEGPKIHLPDPSLGREELEPEPEPQAPPENGAEAEGEKPKPKKKTRRGSRGGRRRKKPAQAPSTES
jgi:predicted RNA-binding protein with TRAM domain